MGNKKQFLNAMSATFLTAPVIVLTVTEQKNAAQK